LSKISTDTHTTDAHTFFLTALLLKAPTNSRTYSGLLKNNGAYLSLAMQYMGENDC